MERLAEIEAKLNAVDAAKHPAKAANDLLATFPEDYIWLIDEVYKARADIASLQAENERLRAELAGYREADGEGRVVGTCTMTCQDEDSEHWVCEACGSEWTYECGGPVDNDVKYCHHCGAKVTSVKARRYNSELDEYEEIETMPEARAALGE